MLPSSSTRTRKVDRACDACRRRKTKCDGPKMQDNVCSNCVNSHKSCTYLEGSTPRGPPKAYVTGLEDRLERLEKLLKQVRPDADFTPELGPPIPRGSWKEEGAPVASTSRIRANDSPPKSGLRLSTHLALNSHSRHRYSGNDSDSSSDGFSTSDSEQMVEGLKGGLRKLTLRSTNSHTDDREDYDAINARFHGKSSLVALIDATRRYKELHVSDTVRTETIPRVDPVPHTPLKRPEFWLARPWELQWEGFEVDVDKLIVSVVEEFPSPSLAAELIDLFFMHVNSQLPLLHRPTFERQFRDRRHHRDIWFSCVCLGMFAVASRWCNDPLVLPRNCTRTSSGALDWTCAGWHYHNVAMRIHRIRQSLLYPACLEEIQTFTLLAAFLRGTTNHPVGWMFVSIGLRKAQDVGAHRRKLYGSKPSADEELWKRAFWCLVLYDRFASAILGRSCAVGEEDFDLDPLLEVNDEYWETDPPFRQPPGVPCRLTCFNLWLRLSQIVTFSVRTIYAVHNPRALLGRIAKVRTDEVIAQLTQALQDWLRSVPDYLQWSNNIEDDELSNQSAILYTTYYLAEMLIYRAFIPPVSTPSSPASTIPHIQASFPALAYCINAARSSARIVEVQLARGWTYIPALISVSQLSAAILTLGVWDCKAKQHQEFEDVKPPVAHIASLMDDIGIFIGALEWAESRWEMCTALLRVLKGALPKGETAGQFAEPSARPRESGVEDSSPPVLSPSHIHYFEDSHSADHWSLPFHSSSVRTRPIPSHTPPLTDSATRNSYTISENDPITVALDKRTPAWDTVHYGNTQNYSRPPYDDDHLYTCL
ncbi:fungal-specific transcription factor domain-containing protein [Mycena maculata]|uniref:Fungal-specific transcription factor domain-containing protein n=1 Tax=Mycena maculata TaxID=230809 RepID=A0AAD7JTX5_9AGAR|nr:fungal-specific transcription factor domain-containing protein [Mycena maculata]